MKKLLQIGKKDLSFSYGGTSYNVHDLPKERKIWVLHKTFNRSVSYRILSDMSLKKPVAVQRLRSRKAS